MEEISLREIIELLYKTYADNFSLCLNNDGSNFDNVYKLVLILQQNQYVNDIDLGEGQLYTFKDFDNDKVPYKDYSLTVRTVSGTITGYIRCCSCDLLFSTYDMVISLFDNQRLNESVVLNESLNMQGFVDALKDAKNIWEILDAMNKYAKEGIVAGALVSAVFMAFQLDLGDKKLVIDNAYGDTPITYSPDWDKTIYEEDEPEWDLICKNCTTTVYNAVKNQCNNDTKHTASGFELNLKNPQAHRIIAMERTMMQEYNLEYGDLVKIEGTDGYDGVYQILDTMNKRFAGLHKIDILVNKDITLGEWEDVRVYKLYNQYDFYKELTLDMAKPKNPKTMKKLQGHLYESYNFNIIK